MSEAIGFVLILLIGVVVAIRQRRQAISQPVSRETTGRIDNLERYNRAGYRFSREMSEDIIDAAALIEQRRSGRHLGPDNHIYVNLGNQAAATDFEVVNHARWIDKQGARNGVFLHAMNGDLELTEEEKNRILYGQ